MEQKVQLSVSSCAETQKESIGKAKEAVEMYEEPEGESTPNYNLDGVMDSHGGERMILEEDSSIVFVEQHEESEHILVPLFRVKDGYIEVNPHSNIWIAVYDLDRLDKGHLGCIGLFLFVFRHGTIATDQEQQSEVVVVRVIAERCDDVWVKEEQATVYQLNKQHGYDPDEPVIGAVYSDDLPADPSEVSRDGRHLLAKNSEAKEYKFPITRLEPIE